jgi:peptidoglycan/xylan/chitin deacetylase (PgdA/CDA1 family)
MLHLPILCYHHIGAQKEPQGHRSLWVSEEHFSEQMRYLAQSGYHCPTLRDVTMRLSEDKRVPRAVILTFDDAYRSFYDTAFPILCRYGFSATVFAVSGEVGGVSRWDPDSAVELMTWPQLREIQQAGMEVGSHTVSHARLTRMPVETAKHEIEDSRHALEQELGAAVSSFAYPYGDWNEIVARLAQEARYRLACSTARGNLHRLGELYHLKRVPIHSFGHLNRFRRRLSPIYDLTCRLKRLSRRFR